MSKLRHTVEDQQKALEAMAGVHETRSVRCWKCDV
jgi:hypothetical protein